MMDFDQYQRNAKRTNKLKIQDQSERANYCALGASAQLGMISGRLKKKIRDGEDYTTLTEDISERLGHLLWYMATMADAMSVSLQDIAEANLKFNQRRWPADDDIQSALWDFDSEFPDDQRLPDKLYANFEVSKAGKLEKMRVKVYRRLDDSGLPFGNEIDSNSWDEHDNYHFHDVYHFSYMAFLGWSPVVRGLLSCKRKDDDDVDRVEDGARARDTEEAITNFIYTYLKKQNLVHSSEYLDTSLLSTVRFLCRDLEVAKCFEKDWEQAILEGAKVERLLVEHRGGWITSNRLERKLDFSVERPASESDS